MGEKLDLRYRPEQFRVVGVKSVTGGNEFGTPIRKHGKHMQAAVAGTSVTSTHNGDEITQGSTVALHEDTRPTLVADNTIDLTEAPASTQMRVRKRDGSL